MDDAVDGVQTRTQPVAAADVIEPDVVETREPVVERVEVPVRRWSRAALFGFLLGVVSVISWTLTNEDIVSWKILIVPTLQWIGLGTAIVGLFFSIIGLGQRRYEGRGYAVLGLLLGVCGIVIAQGFWVRLLAFISSGFTG